MPQDSDHLPGAEAAEHGRRTAEFDREAHEHGRQHAEADRMLRAEQHAHSALLSQRAEDKRQAAEEDRQLAEEGRSGAWDLQADLSAEVTQLRRHVSALQDDLAQLRQVVVALAAQVEALGEGQPAPSTPPAT